jgi:hypothetical protein
MNRRAVFAFEGLRSWRVDSETVVGLQLNHPSGATIILLSEAIVVIVLDRHAYRHLGINDQRGRAAAFVCVFAPTVVLALFMPHMPQALAILLIAILAIRMQCTHTPYTFAIFFIAVFAIPKQGAHMP